MACFILAYTKAIANQDLNSYHITDFNGQLLFAILEILFLTKFAITHLDAYLYLNFAITISQKSFIRYPSPH